MKYCQNCGKRIPQNATYCQYCGSKQINANENPQPLRREQPSSSDYDDDHAAKTTVVDRARLTYTDWAMLIINVLSAGLQFIYAAQSLLSPLSAGEGEFYFCILLAMIGTVINGFDCRECYQNRLPVLVPALGIAGNVLGVVMTMISSTNEMIIIGPVILVASFVMMKRQLHQSYQK